MVQAWYQGGISVFDWTDAAHPKEIASFDRGPVDATHMAMGGSWSVYWYNGTIVSSEIARGIDVAELAPSAVHLAERDRCGQDGEVGLPQRPGAAEDRLAAELRAGQGVHRPAGAEGVRERVEDRRYPRGDFQCREGQQFRAQPDTRQAGDGPRSKPACDPKKVDLLKKALQDLRVPAM